MSNNYDEYEYEDDSYSEGGAGINLLNKIGIAVLVLAAIIIVIFLIKGCSKNNDNKGNNGNNGGSEVIPSEDITPVVNYEVSLLEAGKKYFNNSINELPTSIGSCKNVTLQTLIMYGYTTTETFKTCDSVSTFVRACKLENTSIQYTPWLTCSDKKSSEEYLSSVEGGINSIIPDSTYVEFLFLPQYLKKSEQKLGPVEEVWKNDIKYVSYKTLATTKYYRYRDELFRWNVSSKLYYTSAGETTNVSDVREYYAYAPDGKHIYSDNKTTEAYKWYKSSSNKEYAMKNGAPAYSTKAIGDYTHNEGGVIYYKHRMKTVTGYRNPTKYYKCSTSADSPYIIIQQEMCPSANNPEYKYKKGEFYSCADPKSSSQTIYGNQVKSTDKCPIYGWGDILDGKCPSGSTSDTCQEESIILYKWYKLVDGADRTYYPSGSSSASGEKVFYTSAPFEGAVKDLASKTTTYKWYTQTNSVTTNYTAVAPSGYINTSKTSDSKWSDWSKWSKSNPKISDGRNRQIETNTKIKLQEIKETSSSDWENLSLEYVTEDQLIRAYQTKGYNIGTLDDISNNGDIKYQVKMLVRNKKVSY